MIQVAAQMRIFAALQPVDFRKGIDGLCQLCRCVIEAEPFSGAVFVFRNRSRTSIKLLMYDGQGFWLCQKRLSSGKFNWWPTDTDGTKGALAAHELQLLLWNGNPDMARVSPFWKKILL